MPQDSYTVELLLLPYGGEDARPDLYEVTLSDRQIVGGKVTGWAHLGFDRGAPNGVNAAETIRLFLKGSGLGAEEGLAFGRLLHERLFDEPALAEAWDDIRKRRGAKPLRLVLIFPADASAKLADVPFELLADMRGFLFRQYGATVVRAIREMSVQAYTIHPETELLVAWANPAFGQQLPDSLFADHETATEQAAASHGLRVRQPPCRHASTDRLKASLPPDDVERIVSLVAHGDPRGGRVLLHKDGDAAYPNDGGELVSADDLAAIFRRGRVKVAFLWTCHGGRRHEVFGDLATMLLDPERGDLAAVVASHAALRAEGTQRFVEKILGSLATEGDLERAVAEGRHTLGGDDLQWAAPVYYARPGDGRTVTFERKVEIALQAIRTSDRPRHAIFVEGADAELPYFRGREDDIARGLTRLEHHRLVSITGMPGIGKTETAQAIARAAVDRERALDLDKAMFLRLDGVPNAEALRATLASGFGLPPDQYKTDDDLGRRIGTTRALVVLDNAEDLIRADRLGFRELANALLRSCPNIRLLLATREPLGHVRSEAESELPLQLLDEESSRAVFESIAGSWLSDQRERSPQFADVFGAMLERLGGHPLSLVLVARLAPTFMSIERLWERLQRVGADAVVDPDVVEEIGSTSDARLRAYALTSCVNLSFAPLHERMPGAAEMFLWLANLPSGLPGVLFARVFGDEAENWHAALIRRSLVDEHGPERRIVVPAPLRTFALSGGRQESIPAERRVELLTTSLEALGDWLQSLDRALTSRPSAEIVHRASREMSNLDTLLQILVDAEVARESDLALRIASALAKVSLPFAQLMIYRNSAQIATPLVERVKECIESVLTRRTFADLDKALGDLYRHLHRLEDAKKAYTSALKIYTNEHQHLYRANTLRALGVLSGLMHRREKAEKYYTQALAVYTHVDDSLGRANTLLVLGELYSQRDWLDRAESLYTQALQLYTDLDDCLGRANSLRELGDIYVRTNRIEQAETVYARALEFHTDIDDVLGRAHALKALGDLHLRRREIDDAEAAYTTALEIYTDIDDSLSHANTLAGLANVLMFRDDPRRAFEILKSTLPVHTSIDNRIGVASVHGYMGRAATAARAYRTAVVLTTRTLRICREIEDRFGQLLALQDLAASLWEAGQEEDGREAHRAAWGIAREIGHPSAALFDQTRGKESPPSPEALRRIEAALLKALDAFETEYLAAGNDPYAPLRPEE